MSRVPRLVAAVCALSLVAACGGDDDAEVTTTTVTVDDTATTEPDTTEPATTEPATTEPATTEPATTEPATTEPETTEPETTEPAPEVDTVSLLDVAAEAGDFAILLEAVDAAGLTDELTRRDRTVLAPTDAAFEALGQEAIDALLADPDALRAVLLNHVLPLPQTAADIALFNNVLAVSGESWDVQAGDPFLIGPATIVTPDIEADNGIIHAIDTVLVAAPSEG